MTHTLQIISEDAKAYILPLINATQISTIKSGTSIQIMDQVKGWFYVQTSKINAWVRVENVSVLGIDEKTINNNNETNNVEQNNNTENAEAVNNEQQSSFTEKTMYVIYSSVYVRSEPSTDSEDIGGLVYNDEVVVIDEIDDWYQIEFEDGTGYVAKRLLSESKNGTTRNSDERNSELQNTSEPQKNEAENTNLVAGTIGEEIVRFAKQYLGCPYVYGGSGPSSFDCSGFTMYVYDQFGVSLSHSATAQSKIGEYVSEDNLQPGDLVFFKDYETMDGIGHCGIYIGDGDFIHASSGTGYCVKISTLLSGSYLTRYETARRIF